MDCLNFTNRLQAIRNWFKSLCCDGQPRGSGGIPVGRKVCYAIGGIANPMTATVINISLQLFLLDVVRMEPFYVSMIVFTTRAWDAVTDPLVGYLVGRSRWTRFGKYTPWMVLSIVPAMGAYYALWHVPQGATPMYNVVWFLVAACLFETFMSCYYIPYISLNLYLGGDQRDRDSATQFRKFAETVAMVVATGIQGKVVSEYHSEKGKTCGPLNQTQNISTPHMASFEKTEKAFMISAWVIVGVHILSAVVLCLGVKQQPPECTEAQPSCLASLKMIVCNAQYQWLVLCFVFSTLAFQMSLGNFALFCFNATEMGAYYLSFMLVLLGASALTTPLWQISNLKLGKKSTAYMGLCLFIPSSLVVAYVPINLPVFYIMILLMGMSLAIQLFLPWSMIPDVADDLVMRRPSCRGLGPHFLSIYAFCKKLASGLAAGISTITLQYVGYDSGACQQGDEVGKALTLLFAPVPSILLVIAMTFLSCYSIDERQRSELQEPLHLVQISRTPPPSPPSSSVPRENAEQPHAETSGSHESNTNAEHNSDSSQLRRSQETPVQSNVSPQTHTHKLHRRTGKAKLGNDFPASNSGSRGAHVRSNVLLV